MKLLFIPEQIQPDTNERTPKLREILSKNHTVFGIQDRIVRHVYDQKRSKTLRYFMYILNDIYLLWLSLRKARKNRVDLIFCEGPHYALIGVLTSRILGTPCIWDSHGNTAIFCEQMGKSRFYTIVSIAFEKMLSEKSAALVTVSEKDKQAYGEMGVDLEKIHVVPTCVDFSMVSRTSKSRSEVRRDLDLTNDDIILLFFGSLNYAPNREALDYINSILAPRIAETHPKVKIVVAGRGESPQDTHKSVTILGFVPNIYDLVRASDICIAPIWSGVGILTKVLDMMACGKPTVVTPLAKDGIPELVDNKNVVLASNRDDFVGRTRDLVERRNLHETLGKEAKSTIQIGYTWDKALLKLEEIFEAVI